MIDSDAHAKQAANVRHAQDRNADLHNSNTGDCRAGARLRSCAPVWRAVCFKIPERQSFKAPERQSSEGQSARAPELQSAIRSFFTIFSRWWIRTSCLVVYRYHHVAAAVDLHEEGIVFFFFFFFSDFADMKMKTCQGLARRHALKRPPFP